MKYLIVHADDGGIHSSVNDAIVDGLEKCYFSSTSILVPALNSTAMMARLLLNPHFDVGVHLCLTRGQIRSPWKPVLPASQVQSLVDSNGHLWHTIELFDQHANIDEVEKELRSQIETVLEAGLKPTHIDSHQGTMFLNKELLMLYVHLGEDYDLTPMVLKPSKILTAFINQRHLKLTFDDLQSIQAKKRLALDFLYMADLKNDDYAERKNLYKEVLDNLPHGVSQIIVHPGFDDEELRKMTASSRARQLDYSIFKEFTMNEVFAEKNIQLINWDYLRKQDLLNEN
ncbi:ChbG/HpnK family deacetylase [candidate division KSB1 bacterium]|nr:ChbG/HpnK family deacetylase [candidate division KSB1 bacterium]